MTSSDALVPPPPAAGLRVVVVEKGPWRRLADLQGLELADGGQMYEGGMLATSEDTTVNILAGATLGGGTKINWAAALAAPDHVRKVSNGVGCVKQGEGGRGWGAGGRCGVAADLQRCRRGMTALATC